MPTAAAQECRSPLCGNYAERNGYCPAHYEQRPRGDYAGNLNNANRTFRRLRHSFLIRHPFCNHCQTAPATELDHIIPHKGDPNLFWRQANWQGLCIPCHGRKTLGESLGNYPPPAPDTPRHLIVLMGAPYAGKSTYAAKYVHVVAIADRLPAVADPAGILAAGRLAAAYRDVAHHLQMDHEVLFDGAAAADPAIRKQALRLAAAHRARTTLVTFATPLEVCLARQSTRAGRAVPDTEIRRLYLECLRQAPRLAREGWQRIVTVSGAGADPIGACS